MVELGEIRSKIKKNGKYWIAFVGDSITSCEWVHPNWREIVQYVLNDKLELDWGLRCFNFGYDGATSRDILEKVDLIKSVNPDLVVLMIGSNDPVLGVNVDEHKRNAIKIESGLDTKTIFTTSNRPWNEDAVSRCMPYIEVDRNIGFSNFVDLFKISESFPQEKIYTFESEAIPEENIKEGDLDYWHPNQLGNSYIASVFLKEIFGIDFDPELYIKTTLEGKKQPSY